MEAIKKALQKIVIGLTVGAIVQTIWGLIDKQVVESFAGSVFGVSTGIVAAVLAVIEVFEKVGSKKQEVPRSKYAAGAAWALTGLALQLLGVPLLNEYLGTAKGLPLLALDIASGAMTIVAVLILAEKRIFKVGVPSAIIDRMVEFLGPITSGTEQILTGITATSTFASIGAHAASGDWWR